MRKLIAVLGLVTLVTSGLWTAPTAGAVDDSCTVVKTSRDDPDDPSDTSTAKVVDRDVQNETVDAWPCEIGVYYSPDSGPWSVDDSTVRNATHIGVFNDGAQVSITDSMIKEIGNHDAVGNFDPNGSQRGVGAFFSDESGSAADGTVDGSEIFDYQKGGVVVDGDDSAATITDSDVTGLGPVDFIAQNGVQISRGATPTEISGNEITDNIYTQGSSKGFVSSGILLFKANVTDREVGEIRRSNDVHNNQANIFYIR